MNLKETVASLSEYAKLELGIRFLEIGLPIWDNFSRESVDSATVHGCLLEFDIIDPKIISLSIQLGKAWIQPKPVATQAKLKKDLKELVKEFSIFLCLKSELEPHPQLIFDAASNFLDYLNAESIHLLQESMIYHCINQSVDAIVKEKLLTWDEINTILKAY